MNNDNHLSPYRKKLLDPRWQKRRLEVLHRDEWRCQWCEDAETTLHVHHLYYDRGKDPWEYPLEALLTLCAVCHKQETETRPEQEQILLNILRQRGLSAEDLIQLSLGFLDWHFVHIPEVMPTVLAWIMRSEDLMREMTDRYFVALHAYRQSEKEKE